MVDQAVFRGLREQAELSQAELGRRSGVPQGVISGLERGLQLARPATVRKLAAALGVPPKTLFVTDDNFLKATALTQLRLAAGLSQHELAHKAGVPQATISGLEARRRSGYPATWVKLAAALEVPPSALSNETRPAAPTLRVLRELAGLLTKQLAHRSGVSLATISRLESANHRRVHSATIARLASAFSVADLLTLNEEPGRLDPEALTVLRLLAGLSQAELGRRAGLSQGHISELERGDKTARPATINKLASAFSVADLLTLGLKQIPVTHDALRDRPAACPDRRTSITEPSPKGEPGEQLRTLGL